MVSLGFSDKKPVCRTCNQQQESYAELYQHQVREHGREPVKTRSPWGRMQVGGTKYNPYRPL